jgi:hypothetical protein
MGVRVIRLSGERIGLEVMREAIQAAHVLPIPLELMEPPFDAAATRESGLPPPGDAVVTVLEAHTVRSG